MGGKNTPSTTTMGARSLQRRPRQAKPFGGTIWQSLGGDLLLVQER